MKNWIVRIALSFALIALVFPSATAFADTTDKLSITSPLVLPSGQTGHKYSFQFKASGGTGPYKWSLGTMPHYDYHCCLIGLSEKGKFSSVGDGENQMPYSGTFSIAIKVTDSLGHTAEQVSEYTINDSGTAKEDNGPTKYKDALLEKVSASEISGWAYDNDRKVTVVAEFENTLNKKSKKIITSDIVDIARPEVGTMLSTKFAIGGIVVPLGFSFDPSALIKEPGVYRIKSIKYNDKKIRTEIEDRTTFTIGNPPTTPTTPVLGKHRLVQVDGKGKIYYINPKGMIIPLKNDKVFFSYGNKKDQLESITQDEFDLYKAVTYIKLPGKSKVYKIMGKKIKEVKTEDLTKIDTSEIMEVNQTEFDSYSQ